MDADVGIVGAGPAGAWTAYRLAQQGARVLMFDDSHPREKPCGGGVTGKALAIVADALGEGAGGLGAVAIEQARFGVAQAPVATVPLPARGATPESSLLVVDRAGFDAALAARAEDAGAEWIRERVREVSVPSNGDAVRLTTRRAAYRVDRVVGADGATSLVRRAVSAPFPRSDVSVAAGYFAHGRTSQHIDIGFVERPEGYAWSFPRRDHLAIGICAQADQAAPSALMPALDTWMASTGLADGARLERYGWPIPSLSERSIAAERPAGDRWLLAGDAAGLVDPITREGIFFALQSAEHAARALAGPDHARVYAGLLHAEIYPELARAARLKRRFFRAGFTRLLVEALRRSTSIQAVMADLVGGRQPYATLRGRLLRTLHVGLAWRLWRLEK